MRSLLIISLLWNGLFLFGEDIDTTIEGLPKLRNRLLAETADMRAGNRTEMIDAAAKLRQSLLPPLVKLESTLEKKGEEEILRLINRDLEAVMRDAHIRGHSGGWGGTAVSLDAAYEVVEHIEHRIAYCVWQLMRNSKPFNFEAWHQSWTGESDSDAAAKPD